MNTKSIPFSQVAIHDMFVLHGREFMKVATHLGAEQIPPYKLHNNVFVIEPTTLVRVELEANEK